MCPQLHDVQLPTWYIYASLGSLHQGHAAVVMCKVQAEQRILIGVYCEVEKMLGSVEHLHFFLAATD